MLTMITQREGRPGQWASVSGNSLRCARGITILALACAVAPVSAVASLVIPDVTYPRLPERAASPAGFVPHGWKIEAQAGGDLNEDGIGDVVFVLHDHERANIVANPDGLGEDPIDTNPRILAIAFGRPQDPGYSLAMQNHGLIPRHVTPTLDDPFDGVAVSGIAITNGALQVELGSFANAGSWDMGSVTLSFHWQAGEFLLTDYQRASVMRNSGDMTTVHFDYRAHRKTRTLGHIQNDIESTQCTVLADGPLLSIDQVGDGLAFDPEPEP